MLDNKEVIVTGGAGFIGHHLIDELFKYDLKKVYVIDDLSTGLISNLDAYKSENNFELIEADISHNSIINKLPNVDYVFNLAALVSVPLSFSESGKNNDINIGGFQNILEFSKLRGIKKVVYASSSAVYGNPKVMPINEDLNINPTSPYGFSKYINELYAKSYKDFFNLDSNGFRFFNVFGEGQRSDSPYSGVISIFKEKMINNEEISIFGDGEQSRDFVYVKDLVKILVSSLEIGTSPEIYNVGTGNSISINELFKLMASLYQYNKAPIYKEARIGDIKESIASVSKLQDQFGKVTNTTIKEGLKLLKDD